MPARCILIVPGFRRLPEGEARQRLLKGLSAYPKRMTVLPQKAPGQRNGPAEATHAAFDNQTGRRIPFSVHEASWSDLVPDFHSQGIGKRGQMGITTLLYWGAGMLFRTGWRDGNGTLRMFLITAAALLMSWYISLAVLFYSALATQFAALPPIPVLLPAALAPYLTGSTAPVILAAGAFALSSLMMPFARRFGQMALMAMYFLRDQPTAEGDLGLRTAMRNRVRERIRTLLSEMEAGDELIVVGHSFGVSIALMALGGLGPELQRIRFHSWGGVVGLLSGKERLFLQEAQELATSEPPLRAWHDVVARGDYIASAIPAAIAGPKRHRRKGKTERPSAITHHLTLQRPLGGLFSISERHDYYYRSSASLEDLLLDLAAAKEAPRALPDAGKTDQRLPGQRAPEQRVIVPTMGGLSGFDADKPLLSPENIEKYAPPARPQPRAADQSVGKTEAEEAKPTSSPAKTAKSGPRPVPMAFSFRRDAGKQAKLSGAAVAAETEQDKAPVRTAANSKS